MALFSDIDWVILLVAGGLLLLGKENGALLRTLGRYYGRAMRLKTELLGEFTQAAQIPTDARGRPLSIRQVVLGYDDEGRPSGIPVAVRTPPAVAARPLLEPTAYAPALGGGAWSVARTSPPPSHVKESR
ncbi:MAG: hypothetical protein ACREDK_07265 [Thermoplasmata archaeon]